MAVQNKSAPSLEPLEQLLLQMRNQLKNASARLKHGVVGATEEADGPSESLKPGARCCGGNLRRLRAVTRDVDGLLSKLGRDYTRLGLTQGGETVKLLGSELAALQQGLDVFESAGSAELAQSAMDGLTRAYVGMRETVDELTRCCAPPPPKGKKRAKK
jgi:hypothetical protein